MPIPAISTQGETSPFNVTVSANWTPAASFGETIPLSIGLSETGSLSSTLAANSPLLPSINTVWVYPTSFGSLLLENGDFLLLENGGHLLLASFAVSAI